MSTTTLGTVTLTTMKQRHLLSSVCLDSRVLPHNSLRLQSHLSCVSSCLQLVVMGVLASLTLLSLVPRPAASVRQGAGVTRQVDESRRPLLSEEPAASSEVPHSHVR